MCLLYSTLLVVKTGLAMRKTNRALRVLAGPDAMREINDRGLDLTRIRSIAGASGGPKWLVLSGIDQVLADVLGEPQGHSISLVGSSIGAWRMACLALPDPAAALRRFEAAYLSQSYSRRPSREEISAVTREILDVTLGATGAADILSNARKRLHVITARSRGLAAFENKWLQGLGLLSAATRNRIQRSWLAGAFQRVIFADQRSHAAFLSLTDFDTRTVPLTVDNLAPAIIASGAIPLLLSGVADIPGAPRGVYRDGGIIDYHLDLPLQADDGLCLYPHFYPTIIPGWFDKRLSSRTATPRHFRRTLILAPSEEFVASLPGGKIPDRTDFSELSEQIRISRWREVVKRCRQLGDEFRELIEKQSFAEVAEPFSLRR